MALIGKIDEFRDETVNWTWYKERLEQFLVANDIQDDKQRAILLNVCGAKTYSLVRSLLASANPSDFRCLVNTIVPNRLSLFRDTNLTHVWGETSCFCRFICS